MFEVFALLTVHYWYQHCNLLIKNVLCRMITVSGESNPNCDPLYGRVDALLEQLTKSKSLHILMILDQKNRAMRFSEIKDRVDASSTTVSRRLGELIEFDLVERTKTSEESKTHEYAISEYDYSTREARQIIGNDQNNARLIMIRDSRWKYIFAEDFRPMFFDLKNVG